MWRFSSSLNCHIGPPPQLFWSLSLGWLPYFEHANHSSSKHTSSWYLLLEPHQPSNIGVRLGVVFELGVHLLWMDCAYSKGSPCCLGCLDNRHQVCRRYLICFSCCPNFYWLVLHNKSLPCIINLRWRIQCIHVGFGLLSQPKKKKRRRSRRIQSGPSNKKYIRPFNCVQYWVRNDK